MAKAQRRTGQNSLAYRGVTAATPVQFIVRDRPPMEHDYAEWDIGAIWLEASQKTPGAQIIWVLVRKIAGNATWIQFGGDALQTLTGDTGGAVSPDGVGDIDFQTNFSPLSLVGSPSSFTLTLNVDGTIPNSFPTDGTNAQAYNGSFTITGGLGIDSSASGATITLAVDDTVPVTHTANSGSATATANAITVAGSGGLSTSASGNSLTINYTDVATTIEADSGTATPTAGVLNILGGLNINTSASGNAVTVNTTNLSEGVVYANSSGVYTSLGKGNDGQILIGTTGGTPSWANITSTGGTISITNGANSINLEDNSASAISTAFFAYKTSNQTNVTGQGQQVFFVCDTQEYDLGSDYNNSTGIFTAPSAGTYFFGGWVRFTMPTVPSQSDPIDPNGEIGIVTSGGSTFIGDEYDVVRRDDNTEEYAVSLQIVIELSASETVKPYAKVAEHTATTFGVAGDTNPRVTTFYGYKLS